MKIWIETEALTGGSDQLLWPGALYGLKRLNESGYETSWDDDRLADMQSELLENERVNRTSFLRETADATITGDANRGALTLAADGNTVATGGTWIELTGQFLFPDRKSSKKRRTAETDISITLNIDGTGRSRIETGLKFFDHMLDQIARHGLIDLEIQCKGDLEVDEHHTIEDVAITLGDALRDACGSDKTGIQRYGFLLAMDESQAEVAIDLSNRPYLVWNVVFDRDYAGDFPLDMAEHFFHSLAMNLKATLQIRADGKNDHHKIEAIFKGFARAYRFAVTRTERTRDILPSSKGEL